MPGYEAIGSEEKEAVLGTLDTGVFFRYGFEQKRHNVFWTSDFERGIKDFVGTEHCHAVSSGTAALITALAALGIGAGDEVIVSPFTFVATIEAVLLAGATPVFVAIDRTLAISASTIAEEITERTRAVIVTHMCGYMADIEGIAALAHREGFSVVEDACQAIGATLRGKAAGSFSEIGCLSFDYVKTITCGEGGALITNSNDLYLAAREFSDHGHDYGGGHRGLDGHRALGTNFRLSELHAAVGVAQLKKLPRFLARQRELQGVLKDALAETNAVEFCQSRPDVEESASFLTFSFEYPDQAKRCSALASNEGIATAYWFENNWHYVRQWDHFMRLQTFGRLRADQVPRFGDEARRVSDASLSRTVSLQIMLNWSDAEVECLGDRLRRAATTVRSA